MSNRRLLLGLGKLESEFSTDKSGNRISFNYGESGTIGIISRYKGTNTLIPFKIIDASEISSFARATINGTNIVFQSIYRSDNSSNSGSIKIQQDITKSQLTIYVEQYENALGTLKQERVDEIVHVGPITIISNYNSKNIPLEIITIQKNPDSDAVQVGSIELVRRPNSSETGYGYAIQIVNNLGISCSVSVLVRQTEFPFRSLRATVHTS